MKLPNHVQYWDDERSSGNGIIVTLHYGYTFEKGEHQGVRGFDTITEAKHGTALKRIYLCYCEMCRENKGGIDDQRHEWKAPSLER